MKWNLRRNIKKQPSETEKEPSSQSLKSSDIQMIASPIYSLKSFLPVPKSQSRSSQTRKTQTIWTFMPKLWNIAQKIGSQMFLLCHEWEVKQNDDRSRLFLLIWHDLKSTTYIFHFAGLSTVSMVWGFRGEKGKKSLPMLSSHRANAFLQRISSFQQFQRDRIL